MKNLFIALFAIALFASCTADSLEDYDAYQVDKTKIVRPGSQDDTTAEEVDKDKVQRPGSQGGS